MQHENGAYENGRLRELTRLVDACERLQAAGVDIEPLMRTGKRPQNAQVRRSACSRTHSPNTPLQNADEVAFLLRCRKDAREHFFDCEPDAKNVAVVYAKLHSRVNESSSLREKIDAIRYIGERKTTRGVRAAVNKRNIL